MNCVLCLSNQLTPLEVDEKRRGTLIYWDCSVCNLRFLEPSQRLSIDQEMERYRLHQNCASDQHYLEFAKPITHLIQQRTPGPKILDYGAGKDSPVRKLLSEKNFEVIEYDPVFAPDLGSIQNQKFSAIVLSEVLEHVHEPSQLFFELKNLMTKKALLAISTSLRDSITDFSNWHYRRDHTHVCFYSKKTFQWVEQNFDFENLEITLDRVISLNLK